jgi:hypothetical protein
MLSTTHIVHIVLSLSAMGLIVFMMVAFQYYDLSNGKTNTGWVSNLAAIAMFSNLVMLLASVVVASMKKTAPTMTNICIILVVMHLIAGAWMIAG